MRLLIAGAGGHGRVVADTAISSGKFSEVAFVDDRYPNIEIIEGWPVVGKLSDLAAIQSEYKNFVAAIGAASARLAALDAAIASGYDVPAIIHASAVISNYAEIASGVVVVAGGVVNVGTKVGRGVIVNTGALVDHDCILSEGVHICPGAKLAGNVTVGRCTWFGIGAVAKQGVTIGHDVVIGAGAVVVRDVADGLTVIGNPARPRR